MPSAEELMAELVNSMESLEDATPYAKTMIYGESGVGKTVEAMEFAQLVTPVGKTIIFIDAAEGWVSLKNHEGLTRRTKRMAFKSLTQVDLLLQAISATSPNPFTDVGTIIIDEVSTVAKADLDYVLKVRAIRDPSKDKDIATQPDMGAATERMRRTFGTMLAMKINVVLVSHIREDKDERTGVTTIRPGMMPKLSTTIREKLHDVVHMTATEVSQANGSVEYNRSLQVLPTKGVVAKTRVKGLGVHTKPDAYNAAVVEWMMGKRETLPETEIVIESDPVSVISSEASDDFAGIQVTD